MDPACHSGYGLTFVSELPLPELPVCLTTSPDVEVRLAPVPDTLLKSQFHTAFCEATPDSFLLRVPGVAKYLVQDGCRIFIEPAGHAAPVRQFLYATPMAALLMQRGVAILRGSAVRMPQGALMLIGDPGSGKSVIATALHRAGNPLIADDLCAIDASMAALLPGPRFHCLRGKDIAAFDFQATATPLRPGVDRQFVPLSPPASDPVPIHAVCMLDAWNETRIGIRSLSGAERSLGLLASLVLKPLHDRFGDPLESLQRVAALSRLDHLRLTCPRKERSLADTVTALTAAVAP